MQLGSIESNDRQMMQVFVIQTYTRRQCSKQEEIEKRVQTRADKIIRKNATVNQSGPRQTVASSWDADQVVDPGDRSA